MTIDKDLTTGARLRGGSAAIATGPGRRTRPLRVLIVHNRYRSGQPSGENRVVDQEATLLADAGHHVELFERHSDDIVAMSLAGRVAVPLRVPWNPAARSDLAARLRAERPNVVHIHNVFPLLSPSVLAACADAGVPTVATLHNYQQVCPPGTLYRNGRVCTECVGRPPIPAVRHGCYRGSRLATVPLAAGVALNRQRWWSTVARFLCISRAQRETLVAAGMPADRLWVKYNVVPEPRAVRGDGIGDHLLYLGRLSPEKGLTVLMRAWEGLAERGGCGLPLVIAGTGPLQDEVAGWAQRHRDVRYLGLLSKDQCGALTAGAAAVVVPSSWPETFGLVAVEAMAAGVPVVASGHGSLSELVLDEVTGLLHRPDDPASLADCLTRVLAGPPVNSAMGAAGRRRYEREFTPAIGLDRLVTFYREVIDAARGRFIGPADATRRDD